MDDKLFKLYTLAIMNYEKKFKNRVNNIDDLYPRNWNKFTSYKKKIEIISEAIREDKLIKDTNSYKDYINDIKE